MPVKKNQVKTPEELISDYSLEKCRNIINGLTGIIAYLNHISVNADVVEIAVDQLEVTSELDEVEKHRKMCVLMARDHMEKMYNECCDPPEHENN
jgi:hypothetical protein